MERINSFHDLILFLYACKEHWKLNLKKMYAIYNNIQKHELLRV